MALRCVFTGVRYVTVVSMANATNRDARTHCPAGFLLLGTKQHMFSSQSFYFGYYLCSFEFNYALICKPKLYICKFPLKFVQIFGGVKSDRPDELFTVSSHEYAD